MKNLLFTELYKLFSSFRTYATFGIAIILMAMINIGLYMDGENILDFILQPLKEYFVVDGNILNGYLIAYFSLNTLWVHIPVLVIIVSAYIFSSEFEYGTIKTLLSQPISRARLFYSKLLTMIIYNLLFMVILALVALIPSVLVFGVGDIMVLNEGLQFILEATFLKRYLYAVLFAALGMTAFSSLAMFLAIYFRNTLTAILVAFGILIFHTLIQSFLLGFNSSIQVFIFSYHMSMWQQLFVTDIPFDQILQSVVFLIIMTVTFSWLTLYKFKTLNIKE